MKKTYVKPVMGTDLFSLTQSIAASCEGINHDAYPELGQPNHYSKTSCGWKLGDDIIFVTEEYGCKSLLPEETQIEGYCYNNPNGGTPIFGS